MFRSSLSTSISNHPSSRNADAGPFLGVTYMLRELASTKEPYGMVLLEIACPGHPVSRVSDGVFERLMQVAAARIMRALGDCLVARLGANRLVVLLEGPVDEAVALSVTARMHETLRTAFEIGRRDFFVTTSIGIGLGGWSAEPSAVLEYAERALDRVKANGGDATAVESSQQLRVVQGHAA